MRTHFNIICKTVSSDPVLPRRVQVTLPLPKRLTHLDWDAIAAAYAENTETLAELSKRFGVSSGGISNRARREEWSPRQKLRGKRLPSVTFEGRLARALDRQITELEERWSDDGEEINSAQAEKEARTLSVLIRTAEKLKEIEIMSKKTKITKSDGQSAKSDRLDRRRMRETLERRLDQLIASAHAQGISERPNDSGT